MAFSYFSSVESNEIGSVQEEAQAQGAPYAANGVESVDAIATPELDVAAVDAPAMNTTPDQPVAMDLGMEAERMPWEDMPENLAAALDEVFDRGPSQTPNVVREQEVQLG